MKTKFVFRVSVVLFCFFLEAGWISAAQAQEIPSDYQQVLNYLGRPGDFKAGVLKINVPRNDIRVTVTGVPMPTAFGFGGWVALTKGAGGKDVMMGDLVLEQEKVNPVMSALLEHGLEATALHNHFFWEEPRLFYMHIHGYGEPMDLARRLKPALELIGRPPAAGTSAPASPTTNPAAQMKLDTAKISQIAGHPGETSGSVYKITVGRDDLGMKEMGAAINARMGLNSWAAFVGADEQAAVAGDIAMLEAEIQPVLRTLLKQGLTVVAIHHHMTGVRPAVIFLHYWGQGPVDKLAAGFRAALDELGKARGLHTAHRSLR